VSQVLFSGDVTVRTGDDIVVPEHMQVYCPKCAARNRRPKPVITGTLAAGTAIRLKCSGCHQFVQLESEECS